MEIKFSGWSPDYILPKKALPNDQSSNEAKCRGEFEPCSPSFDPLPFLLRLLLSLIHRGMLTNISSLEIITALKFERAFWLIQLNIGPSSVCLPFINIRYWIPYLCGTQSPGSGGFRFCCVGGGGGISRGLQTD